MTDTEWLAKVREACDKSPLFRMFLRQNFWHAHHVDIVWRYDGQDRREQADWLKDIFYAVRRHTPGQMPPPGSHP